MSFRFLFPALLALSLAPLVAPAREGAALRIHAAASLGGALDQVAGMWAQQGHALPTIAYGASSVLARQIEAGARADIYASADPRWMAYLHARDRIDGGSLRNLLGNRLILVAPKDRPPPAVQMRRNFDLAAAFRGRLCLAETRSVPAGIYARQALEALGWWTQVSRRLVETDDVRAAVAFVERGECALGVVYASDLAISAGIVRIATFDSDTHDPIVYPFAQLQGAAPGAAAFMAYLQSPESLAVFTRQGFVLPEDTRASPAPQGVDEIRSPAP